MGINNFNYRQCRKALQKLGFRLKVIRKGKHDKYYAPANILSGDHDTLFIMIPRHRKLYCQNEIVNEIRRMGGNALVEEFRRHL